MGKKRKKSVPVSVPKAAAPMVIDMNRLNLKKQHEVPAFKTGGHITEKDRPRKKNWKKELKDWDV